MSPADLSQALRCLRPSASAELDRLEVERKRLLDLITFIDDYTGEGSRPPTVIELVRERPGIRASMIAIALGRTPRRIAEELAGHERRGRVRREGLGWRAV